MKAAVLGIGTELTDGQILNKNASWISAQLKKLGLQTTLHLVVPDDRKLIMQALHYCESHCDLLFITGGLGPTSDDFTREVVTEWIHQPLEFDEDSWKHLSERLSSRGYEVKEIQRQQCYFPRDAKILFNPQGTANAFQTHYKKIEVFVLPGPPREIEAVWNLSIDWWLKERTAGLDAHITRMWDTMGKGESDIAVIAEEVLQGVEVEKGYRVHLPYVEVKISYRESEEEKFQPIVQKLTEALSFCTITRDGEDVAASLAGYLSQVPSVQWVDEVSGPFLANRILPHLRSFMTEKPLNFSTRRPKSPKEDGADLQLQLLPITEHSSQVIFEYRGRRVVDTIETPYKTANMQERRLQYFAECALIFWLKQMRNLFAV